MKRLICIFFVTVTLIFSLSVSAADKKPPLTFELDSVSVSQVVRVIFNDVVKSPYVLDPSVVKDERLVSFRWDSSKGEIKPFLRIFLDALGYQVVTVSGIDLIKLKDEVKKKDDEEPEKEVFIYQSKFRDGSYLVDLLSPLFKGSFTSRRSVQAPEGAKQDIKSVPAGSAAASIERRTDMLIFNGLAVEIEKLKKLLPQVDIASGEVLVKGVLYEVQTGKKDGSGFQLAAGLLSGKLSVGLGGAASALDNFVRLKSNTGLTIDAVLSALSSDSRFKIVSSPSLRVRSGSTAKITVGQDVPVLGSVSYPSNGQAAVQSVEYRSSGVIFDLTPDVHGSVIDLKVGQQVSNFVKTESGVNSSPTLIKRDLSTSISMLDGEVIVLGGLNEDKDSNAETGFSFLPKFMRTRSEDVSKSEILLLLQVTKI